MTTKEFIKKMEELGYKVLKVRVGMDIHKNEIVYASVYTKMTEYDISYPDLGVLSEKEQKEFLGLIKEYSQTPIEEREEQDKYHWKLKGNMDDEYCYINYVVNRNTICIDNRHETHNYKSKFTENEFRELCRNHGTVYEAYEKEPIN